MRAEFRESSDGGLADGGLAETTSADSKFAGHEMAQGRPIRPPMGPSDTERSTESESEGPEPKFPRGLARHGRKLTNNIPQRQPLESPILIAASPHGKRTVLSVSLSIGRVPE